MRCSPPATSAIRCQSADRPAEWLSVGGKFSALPNVRSENGSLDRSGQSASRAMLSNLLRRGQRLDDAARRPVHRWADPARDARDDTQHGDLSSACAPDRWGGGGSTRRGRSTNLEHLREPHKRQGGPATDLGAFPFASHRRMAACGRPCALNGAVSVVSPFGARRVNHS